MPRNGSGTYTLPQAPFVPATTISSAAVNSDLSDVASALTASVCSDGQTPMTGQFKAQAGSAGVPGITFSSALSNGFYSSGLNQVGVAIGGVPVGFFSSIGWTSPSGIPTAVPYGIVVPYAGSFNVPTGWLLCFGQEVSRSTYGLLFGQIGTAFGAGDGVTSFNLPDMRGIVAAGKDNMGGVAAGFLTSATMVPDGNTVGARGGAQTHVLTQAELASHSHTGSGTTSSGGVDHNHAYTNATNTTASLVEGAGRTSFISPSASGTTSGASAFLHTHTYSFTSSSVGGDAAHINVQPTMIFNYIIFAGA